MSKLACSIGFSEHVIVGASRKAGGLCLMWSNTIAVKVLEFNSRTIAIMVQDEFCSWSLIGFYGLPYHAKLRKAWT